MQTLWQTFSYILNVVPCVPRVWLLLPLHLNLCKNKLFSMGIFLICMDNTDTSNKNSLLEKSRIGENCLFVFVSNWPQVMLISEWTHESSCALTHLRSLCSSNTRSALNCSLKTLLLPIFYLGKFLDSYSKLFLHLIFLYWNLVVEYIKN